MRRIIRQKSEQQALEILSALCASAEYCSQDMIGKMKRWNMPEETRNRVIDKLISNGFIDDSRYCKAFVHDKIKYAKWGRRKLELALYRKGIPQTISTPILDVIPEEDYIHILKPLLKTKAASVHAESDYEFRQKLFRFAAGRGFAPDLIMKCMPAKEETSFAESKSGTEFSEESFPEMEENAEIGDFTDQKDPEENSSDEEEQTDLISNTFGDDDKIDRVSTTFGAQKTDKDKSAR